MLIKTIPSGESYTQHCSLYEFETAREQLSQSFMANHYGLIISTSPIAYNLIEGKPEKIFQLANVINTYQKDTILEIIGEYNNLTETLTLYDKNLLDFLHDTFIEAYYQNA